ncbi:MAG: hypothetical protein AABY64_01435 [Bdellovibrionota bacterium]
MRINFILQKPTLIVGFCFLFLSSCATYQGKVDKSRQFIQAGQTDLAIAELKTLADKADGDKLVYLLDYGTALQMGGQYKESNQVFLQADKLSEQLDFHSASRVAGSLLLSEEMVQYKGDTFEKIFINAYLAMNYLELNMLDDALVESRRINEKYLKLRAEEKKVFELNPFSKYLSALIWEADQKWDDAAIAYAEAYKLDPLITPIREDLIRSAKKARRMDEYESWKKKFPEVKEKPEWYDKSSGELVILVQQGWGPRKNFNPIDFRWPILKPVYSSTQKVHMTLEGVGNFESQFVYNTEGAAIKTLQEDALSLAGRRIAGIVAKDLAAQEVRKKNEALGAIAWVVMRVSDRADLRQWSTLPQTIQIMRVFLKAGDYKLSLQGLTSAGQATADVLGNRAITIKAGRKTFVNWRTVK